MNENKPADSKPTSMPPTNEASKSPAEFEKALQEQKAAAEAGKTTQMVAAAPKKMVKIRAKYPIQDQGISLAPGDVADVPEDMAKEFCDRKFDFGYDWSGERDSASATRRMLARAERVAV